MAKKKQSFLEKYEDEYLSRLAFGIVQFWPAEEELPDDRARDSEAFYRVSIARLNTAQQRKLVAKLQRMTTKTSGVFVPEIRGTDEAWDTVEGVVRRFRDLGDFWPFHKRPGGQRYTAWGPVSFKSEDQLTTAAPASFFSEPLRRLPLPRHLLNIQE